MFIGSLRGWRFGVWVLVSSSLMLLCASSPAIAHASAPSAAILVHLPTAIALLTKGIGFFVIVGLESVFLARQTSLSWVSATGHAIGANICSGLVGGLLLVGLVDLSFFALFWGIAYLLLLILTIAMGAQGFTSLKSRLVLSMAAGAGWFVVLIGSTFLLFSVESINPAPVWGMPFPDWTVPIYINLLQLMAVAAFMACGLLATVCVESSYLRLFLPRRSLRSTLQLVWLINVRSFVYLALPITVGVLWWFRSN